MLNKETLGLYRCARYAQLTSLPLYMDQVMLVLEEALAPFATGEERLVTPAMINNYVKHKLISPPVKKKYGREQISRLMVLSLLKRVLSLQEIQGVLRAMAAEQDEQAAYDLFCERLEYYLARVFADGKAIDMRLEGEGLRPLLDAALCALTAKLMVQVQLEGDLPA